MKRYINKVTCHHIITGTTQKHDVLLIISVLGNYKLEYSTKGGHFCRKCHLTEILHALVHF